MLKKTKSVKSLFPPGTKKYVLATVFAHPDDEALRAGGLLAMAAAENIETHVICVSRGELGIIDPLVKGERLIIIRKQELTQAAGLLGVAHVHQLDLPDGKLYLHKKGLEDKLWRRLTTIYPGVIITHDPTGITGHPDHITTSLMVKKVWSEKMSRRTTLYFAVLDRKLKLLTGSVRKNVDYHYMPEATHALNISDHIEIKSLALETYQSQKLSSTNPLKLASWQNLFPFEYYHQAKNITYQYRFFTFSTRNLNFHPDYVKIKPI